MKLLIVDDQPRVVEGLVHGIDWNDLGFTTVLTALNALEARILFQDHTIDILLCDIEMPMESGLYLVNWIKDQNFKTRCIFLTAHAKFSYAQEALKLGGFDYIIQPAPYSEIRQVVQRAIEDVKAGAEKDELYTMGKVFRQQEPGIKANVLRDYLKGNQNDQDIETLEKMGRFPKSNQDGYLILLQILRWQTTTEKREGSLLAVTLGDMINELFTVYNQLSIVAYIADNTFALVLQSKNESDDLNFEALLRQLKYLNSVCEQCVKCSIASYVDGPLPVKQMTDSWSKLVKLQNENVALKADVYPLGQHQREPYAYQVPEIKRWFGLLHDGYGQAMEDEANQLLERLLTSGQMNVKTLNNFYQDFFQMLYRVIEGSENLMNELFRTTEELELYRNGMRSVDQMKQLIHHVAVHFDQNPQLADQEYIVKQAVQYINEHLESEIRRDELAEHVHMNADYLTRIFKKETGYTIKEYIIIQKMQEAKSLLRTTTLPISTIAAKVGYCSFSHFSVTYKKILGLTPQEERQGRANAL